MAFNIIKTGLLNADVVRKAVKRYLNQTNDYALFDRFDSSLFSPTFNAASNNIDCFGNGSNKPFSIPLNDLIADSSWSLSSLLEEFSKKGMGHGYRFPLHEIGTEITIFYLEALQHFPDSFINTLISWKRTGSMNDTTMLPGRKRIWDEIWRIYKFKFAYHPSIFLAMTQYQGPIPIFLQQVVDFILKNFSSDSLEVFFDQFIDCPWIFKTTYSHGFITLWHQIMKETTAVYLPKLSDSDSESSYSTISYDNNRLCYISNSNKLLCTLLLLFNRDYREKLDCIILQEPVPPILMAIFTRFPGLQ